MWKFWKDIDFKSNLYTKLEALDKKNNSLLKEMEAVAIENNDNSKKIDSLSNYLKRLDQNASRLADDIRGEQAMTKAIEMARRGQDHLDIIKATGLSNEEVEAIIHSHKEN